jgi:hypothetical protein
MGRPSREQIVVALQAAGTAHHEFEVNALQGRHDEQWSGWYAAYVLGRLGDFVAPTVLAGWLSDAPASDNWSRTAADYIQERLGASH